MRGVEEKVSGWEREWVRGGRGEGEWMGEGVGVNSG